MVFYFALPKVITINTDITYVYEIHMELHIAEAAVSILENDNLSDDKLTVLFVDDEKSILSSLRRLFRTSPYKILTANSGAEGLEIFKEKNIDLVISDMRMPQMDGAEFLAEVANKWPDTIRILLTGYSDLESTIAAVNRPTNQEGACDYHDGKQQWKTTQQ